MPHLPADKRYFDSQQGKILSECYGGKRRSTETDSASRNELYRNTEIPTAQHHVSPQISKRSLLLLLPPTFALNLIKGDLI